MRTEDTISTYIADILRERRNTWSVEPQEALLRESKRPDITVTETGKEPVVIEVKIDHPRSPNLEGEAQAKGRLGKRLASFEIVKTAVALRVPHRFRQLRSGEIPDALRHADDLHYALFSVDEPHRFPNNGWITGNISDVATALRIGAIPISKVVQASEDLEGGVNEAAILLAAAVKTRPQIAETIEKILYQEAGEQTYRMAMLIITNAFVFQSALAGTPGMDTVPSLVQLQTVNAQLNISEVLNAWDVIRRVNYRPIFDVAYRLTKEVLAIDDRLVGTGLIHITRHRPETDSERVGASTRVSGHRLPTVDCRSEIHQGELYTPRIRCAALRPRLTRRAADSRGRTICLPKGCRFRLWHRRTAKRALPANIGAA